MEVEYRKDIKHNYIVIKKKENKENDTSESFCIKMLERQQIQGILPLEQKRMDDNFLLYYDITSKQSMSVLLDKTVLSYEKVRQLFTDIIGIMERAFDYLLPEDNFILQPDYIFMGVSTKEPSLCFLPGYAKPIKEQMNGLIEYLMNKVDYNDKEAVLLVYSLYAASREEGYTFEHLLAVLQNKPSLNEYEKKQRTKGANTGAESISSAFCPEIREEDQEKKEGKNKKIEEDKKREENKKEENKYKEGNKAEVRNKEKYWYKIGYQEKREHRIREENKTSEEYQEREAGLQAHNKNSDQTLFAGENRNIPVMLEKLDGEEEIAYYSFVSYAYTGICLAVGIMILALSLYYKVIYNSFGSRLDYSKLFALVLILFCGEGYLLQRIWNKKNKITKIIPKKEYVNPKENIGKYRGIKKPGKESIGESVNKAVNKTADKTEMLLCDKLPIRQEFSASIKQSCDDFNDFQEREPPINQKVKRAEISRFLMPSQDAEEDNPTCLLNPLSDDTEYTCNAIKEPTVYFILKPLNETEQEIPVKVIPFFIGKLKENVDYYLEKEVVSRYHAKITKEEEQYYITDLNSTNGTFVNGQAVQTYQKVKITIGDEIAIADIKYRMIEKE